MNCWKRAWLAITVSGLSLCRIGQGEEPRELVAPKATPIPKRLEKFGRTRIDNYYWLEERTNPKVIAYLDAENDYTDRDHGPHQSPCKRRSSTRSSAGSSKPTALLQSWTTATITTLDFKRGSNTRSWFAGKDRLMPPRRFSSTRTSWLKGTVISPWGTSDVSPDNHVLAYGG